MQVVLADDHGRGRRSLRLPLDGEDGMDIVAEATDVSSVVRDVHGHVPHVLVLDLRMPNGSGGETIRRLRDEVPDTNASPVGFVLKIDEMSSIHRRTGRQR